MSPLWTCIFQKPKLNLKLLWKNGRHTLCHRWNNLDPNEFSPWILGAKSQVLQHWSWNFLWTTFVEHLQPTNPGKIKIYRWTDCPWNTSSKFLEFLFHIFLKKRGSPQKKVSSWSSGIKSSTSVFWRGSGNMEWIPTILVPNNTSSCAPRLFAKPLKRMLIFGTYCFDPKETRGIFDVAPKKQRLGRIMGTQKLFWSGSEEISSGSKAWNPPKFPPMFTTQKWGFFERPGQLCQGSCFC